MKYKNKKVIIDGIGFDSMGEGKRYYELKIMQDKGEISDLRLQVPFILADSVKIDGRMKPAIRYFADFVYMLDGKMIVEDFKSQATKKDRAYRIKKHLMMSVLGIEIKET